MSIELLDLDGVMVTMFAGPASDGAERRRVQITTPDGYVVLTWPQWSAFADAIRSILICRTCGGSWVGSGSGQHLPSDHRGSSPCPCACCPGPRP